MYIELFGGDLMLKVAQRLLRRASKVAC